MDRRTTIKWMFAAAASVPALQSSLDDYTASSSRSRSGSVARRSEGLRHGPELVAEWKPAGHGR